MMEETKRKLEAEEDDTENEWEKEKLMRLEIEAKIRSEFEEKLRNSEELILKKEELILKKEEQLKKSENLRLEAEDRALKAERTLKILQNSQMKSLSCPSVYNIYVEDSKKSNFDNLNLPVVDQSKLISAWDALISDLPEFKDGSDEKTHVHPFIGKILEKIIGTFNLHKIKFHYEARLNNPNYRPDFCLTSSQISEPSWPDCLSFIECKSTNVSSKEGGGQVITYMMNTLFPNTDILNFSNAPEITFSLQTNGRSIQFFVMKKLETEEFEKFHSPFLNFFDAKCAVGAPSDGFKLLCRFLSFLGGSPIAVEEIKIRGGCYKVLKTFQKSKELIVGLIDTVVDGMCVAKCAVDNNKSTLFSIRKDALMYKILKNSTVKTLDLSRLSDSNHLIFKEIALCNIKSWANYLLFQSTDLTDENVNFNLFVRCFIKVFDEIEKLHNFGYTHSDIRPDNILILNGDIPCLIDFVTATKHGTSLDWLQGTLVFMAKDLLTAQAPYIFKRKYDMESFAYSLLDCADKHFSDTFLKPQNKDFLKFEYELVPDNEYHEFYILREKQLSKLRESQESYESHFPNARFVNLFLRFFDKLTDIEDDLTGQDYVELRNILVNSIA